METQLDVSFRQMQLLQSFWSLCLVFGDQTECR